MLKLSKPGENDPEHGGGGAIAMIKFTKSGWNIILNMAAEVQ